ncbi:hypothetical protein [Ruegeria sp. THAF33]|uniref:hypothetical protein n=1 Tax=Ruegeria sp. THAF33 TaxID=2587853 RepID=UPI00126805E0|nr:hypothetical protein [Ruegeria sp. THAF33]QFT72353.1 hypothetical protein FIU92_04880 [Ruegeria sp. THAF33]
MFRPSVQAIMDVMSQKGFVVFDTPTVDWNLNIVGIRAHPVSPKKFDDVMTVFHRFLGVWDIAYYPMTADPSDHYLKNPINPDGTAILAPGQYRSCYKIDIHKRGRPGGHKALCQRLGTVAVFRDNNRDGNLNLVNPQSGMFGINLHKGPNNGDDDTANTIYSAGCQVFADQRHFAEFLLKCEAGRDAFGNKFTYTLLDQADFE